MSVSLLQEPFAQTFVQYKGRSVMERTARAMLADAAYYPVRFSEKAMLPSADCCVENSAFVCPWNTAITFREDIFNEKIDRNPSVRDEMFRLKEEMLPYCAGEAYEANRDIEFARFSDAQILWAGGWIGHGNPDFGKILRLGTNGIRAEIEQKRAAYPGRDEFYDSCRIAMDALDAVGENIRKTALRNASVEQNDPKKSEFLKIADVFTRVPMEPAWDMYSAVMSFWAAFSAQGCDSPGNLDRYMYPYFEKSDREECRRLIRRMLEGFHDHRSWNLCISGSDEYGNDTTNELSYMLLEEITATGYNTPNLTMRVHRNTPEKLWDMAVRSIAQGTGLPALYNDETVCAALEKIGIPPHDAHEYCMNGCNQIDILGKSHMGLEDGEVNLGKVLELTLHNGFDVAGEQPVRIMQPLGDVFACETFDDFLDLYLRYQDYASDITVRGANDAAALYAKIAPNPLRTCLFEGCLDKGKSYKDGGPLYGHAQILLEGIADTADSLWAIKKLVYTEKKYSMRTLVSALDVDFLHFEDLHNDCRTCEKFGNDIPGPDEICGTIVNRFNRYLKTKRSYRGGVFTGGCSTFDRAADRGMQTAALPNGKRKNEPTFADSIAATPGRDSKGPTASIRSCLHYDQTEPCSGFVMQMKFTKDLFDTDRGREAFKTLAKTYFSNGGQQMSVNVTDRETLLKAQKNPEAYKSLVVRVGGFSAYFCELDEELQQNIIDRTAFNI